jgi:nitroimidazol reductase NimA-like FMN-containing flavoprotein (pyridoxamine 5'-phosphate oxidase superfamily)
MEPFPEAVKHFVAEARVCRLAGVRPSGEPHVIPVCPVFDGGETLYVDIGAAYTMAEAVRDSPRLGALIDEYDDDWSRLRAVLLRCEAREVGGDEQERAWEMIRAKFPQYRGVGWEPRLTLALRVYDWRQWGIV